jgi:hypothetical protein
MLQEPSNNRWKRIPSNRESINNSGPGIRAGCIPVSAAVVVPRKQAARNRQCRQCHTRRSHRCPDTRQQAPAVDSLAAGWPRVLLAAPALPAARWTTRDWLAPDLNSAVALRSDPYSAVALRFDPHSAVALPFDLYFDLYFVARPIG